MTPPIAIAPFFATSLLCHRPSLSTFQTEYKLHLLSPAPHRFEKLKTQLKWRLIEGGSQALYELGVVDDGTLVGLSKQDMDASLETLGRMLAGLGGGQVRVNKVFRLAGDGSRDHGLAAAQHRMQELDTDQAGAMFASFWVEGADEVVRPVAVGDPDGDDDDGLFPGGVELDLDLVLDPPPIPITSAGKPLKSAAPVHHSPAFCGRRYKKLHRTDYDKDKVSHPWAERTPDERAALKREKRDKGRRKSDGHPSFPAPTDAGDAASDLAAVPPGSRGGLSSAARAIPQANQRKPLLKLSRSEPKPGGVVSKLRPSLLKEGEERWVVEVEVSKRAGGRRADGGWAELEESEVDGEKEGDDGDEPEHGWAYLDFDFLGPDAGVAVAR